MQTAIQGYSALANLKVLSEGSLTCKSPPLAQGKRATIGPFWGLQKQKKWPTSLALGVVLVSIKSRTTFGHIKFGRLCAFVLP